MTDDIVQAAVTDLAETIAVRVSCQGWDQPAAWWELRTTDAEEVLELAGADMSMVDTDKMMLAFDIRLAAQLDGDPAVALLGKRIGDDAVGAALTIEAWDYGPATRARALAGAGVTWSPTDDPGRREIRITQVVLRDGTSAWVRHERGQHLERYNGPLSDQFTSLLAVTVGRPSGLTITADAGDIIGRTVAVVVLATIKRGAGVHMAVGNLAAHINARWNELERLPVSDILTRAGGRASRIASLVKGHTLATLAANTDWPDWHTVHHTAAEAGDPIAMWADAALFAEHFDQDIPNVATIGEALKRAAKSGLGPNAVNTLHRLITIQRPPAPVADPDAE